MKFAKLENGNVNEVAEADTYNEFLEINSFIPFENLTEEQKQQVENFKE